MDAALVLSLLRHWRGIVEGAVWADVCVDKMRRKEQNTGGEEERGKKKFYYKTQWSCNPYIPNNDKKALISAYVDMCSCPEAVQYRLLYSIYSGRKRWQRWMLARWCRESTSVCRLLHMQVCERAVQQLNIRMHTNLKPRTSAPSNGGGAGGERSDLLVTSAWKLSSRLHDMT